MAYRCEIQTVEGLVQLLASNLLPHGYWFYVTGRVPANKDLATVDAKLIAKYGIDRSRAARARRKRAGYANLRYLRQDRFFILLATYGRSSFFEQERTSIRDIRNVPLQFAGYSISYRRGGRRRDGEIDAKWHSHVAISRKDYRELRAHFWELATRVSADRLALELYGLPFEPYAPVRRQMLNLLRSMNRVRRKAGLSQIPHEILPLRRRIVRPFEPAVRGRSSTSEDSHQRKPVRSA
jgi:hypothetical protein